MADNEDDLTVESALREVINSFQVLSSKFESKYLLPNGFLQGLLHEDDWSFVIKLQALIEVAVSKTLADVLDERLHPLFTRIDFGNKETGKLKFANALNLFPKTDTDFMTTISELRNKLAHNIESVGFSFANYIERMNPSQDQQFFKVVTGFSSEKARSTWIGRARRNVKSCLWLYGMRILFSTFLHSMKAEVERVFTQVSGDRLRQQFEQKGRPQ